MNYTKGEWKAGNIVGLTGPTTGASPSPVCGGEDWPYQEVTVGQDTVAIVPAQPKDHNIGFVSKPMKGSDMANANLISAAPDVHEALKEAEGFVASPTVRIKVAKALAKAEGKE